MPIKMKKSFILTLLMAFVLMAKASSHDPDRLIGTHWTFLPNYEHNLTITGIIILDGESLQNSPRSANLEIGAFCGDECRGSYLADYVSLPFFNGYAYQMQVYSNQASGEQIVFRVYDHEADMELDVTCLSNLQFIANTQHGNLRTPYEFVFYSNYTITTTTNPSGGGQVTGGGNYMNGTNCTLTATANSAYDFVNWTKNGTQVSANATYSFTVNESAEYVANFTLKTYNISASANPTQGGTVSGSGTYTHGTSCTLTATPGSNYDFVNWTKNGSVVSSNPNYTFTVTGAGNYVANFTLKTYNITATVNPSGGGTISGAGSYVTGSTCTLTASPNEYFIFVNWTKNGTVVSTNTSYTFTVSGNAAYVANFSLCLPDLHVTEITHSDFVAGQQVTISWTVQNDGTAPTPNGAMWYDRVWLSVESRVAADDNTPILLGTFDNISALDVGEHYTQTKTFNIPLELSGDYFLFVLTDAYDCHTIYWDSQDVPIPYNPPPYLGCLSNHCRGNCANVADNRIYEKSEYEHGNAPGGCYNDNFFYTLLEVVVPPLPDLQVTSITAPNNFFSGINVNVTATISNLGDNVTLSDHWTDALFVAFEPNFNAATCLATVPHSGTLPAGSSYQVTFTGSTPPTLFGEAYFFVYTDYYGQVYEHVFNHNNVTMSESVNIILLPPADLEPADIIVPTTASTCETFSYSYKVYNNGAGNPDVSHWVDKVYISPDDTLGPNATLLKTTHHYGNLPPEASYSVSESFNLPYSISAGQYYLYVHTDANANVFEYQTQDNNILRSSRITLKSPDLQITDLSVPELITSGYPINLSYSLVNNGNGSINNRAITDKLFLSQTGSLNNAIEIASQRHSINLSVGQSMSVMCNSAAPGGLADGTYHLIVVTDSNSEIHESNEGNNTISLYPMSVMHQPMPDLQPLSLNLPSVIQAGDAVSVNFDITNLGDLDLLNSNCTFNVYALQNDNEILCPVQSQTSPSGSNVSIGINETVHFVRSIQIPASVTSACTAFKLYADKENHVIESNENNNTITANAAVLNCPLPDLTVSNVVLPTMQAGAEVQLSLTVSNQGTAGFNGSFVTSVYAIVDGTQVNCPLKQQIAPETTAYSLAVGESLQFTLKVLVPPTVTSTCNVFSIVVDATNAVLEINENNNTANATASVTNYPFNLATQNFTVPSTVTAGEITNISWKVKNTGTCPSSQIPFYLRTNNGYTLVEGTTLPSPWKDRVFLSDDATWSDNDLQLLSVDRNTVLNPNRTYTVQQSITLPYSAVGSKYLICVSDATQITFDNNRTNNIVAIPVEVELGVLPDLHITTLNVEPVMTSDNAYWVHYTVVNEGERVTQKDNWTDAFYISETYAIAGAFQLGSKIHHGALEPGASYNDSIEILAPMGLEGDYFLLGYTDATDKIYEYTNESNNLFSATVTVVAPEPCDLIAVQPEFPTTAVSGEDFTVSWQLRNIGANPATGRVRNAVYLSSDETWNSDDVMLGYANVNINIPANGQQSCQLSGTLNGIEEGNYYVIIKANILNALNELTYENNICVSMLTTEIGFPSLAIGEEVDREMATNQYIYYKIQVGPEYEGQTLSCKLTTLEQQVANGLYVSHEEVPTPADFQFGSSSPYVQENEVLIPSLEQGDYYLLAKGSAYGGNPQQIHIATTIINFEILSIDADHGSNTGSVTAKITGAKFDSIMDFRLVQGGDYLPAEKVFFSNSTETFTTFNLLDMPLGTYAMEAELPSGVITIKDDAFTIEEGLPAELAVNIVAPSSVRNGSTVTVNIEFGNIGSTDLNISGFYVVSKNGHYISLDSDGLAAHETQLYFDAAESNGNPDVLRPGARGTRPIYVKANNNNTVRITIIPIRNTY